MSERILNRDAHTGGGRGTSSFNVCIPVTISPWEGKEQPGRRVLIRFPLPYRVGEAFRPGNGDEKIRCEAGAYAYLQEKRDDSRLRNNLFHDLSWIMLSMARTPLPKIRPFIIDRDGFLRLANRPVLKFSS